MKSEQAVMRPHDIVVLLKIISYGSEPWLQKPMATELVISQSELSKSIARSKNANLLDNSIPVQWLEVSQRLIVQHP